MVMVDSSVWIEALRKKGDLHAKLALEKLLDAYEAGMCTPIRLEVLGGVRKEERKRIGHYLSIIPYRSVSEKDWEHAITVAWTARNNGLSLPWMDVLIASVCLQENYRLYTLDRHFYKLAEFLPLALYQPGYGGNYNPN